MKTIVTCASLAAVGMVGLQAQDSTDSSATKPFSLSAKVRGFYDDNYTTAPSHPTTSNPLFTKRSSWGIDAAPSVAFTLVQDLTMLRLSYDYDVRYYEDRVNNKYDQTHLVAASIEHRFTERYKLSISDSFAIGQEPSILDPGQQASYLRTDGNNMRNFGSIALLSTFSEKWGSRIAYENTWYSYDDAGHGASRSALLDRIENLASIDLRYQLAPDRVGLFGYQFGYVEQTSKDSLTAFPQVVGPIYVDPTVRNRESHYGFLGYDQDLTARLSYKLRAGVQYSHYPNAQPGNNDSLVSPYADGSIQYHYAERSLVQAGIKYGMNQTDVAISNNIDPRAVTDAESLTLYAAVVHYITPQLSATLRGLWQEATFNNGVYNGKSDNYYSADLNLTYEINRHFAVEAGYVFDRLDSDLQDRSFSRNRGYAGIRATY